jgi:hypothetical protein
MNIQGTQVISLNISEFEQKRIAMQFLADKFDWSQEYSIKDGNIYREKTMYGSHSFTDTVLVREASPLDYHIEAIYKNIN